jgi:phage shock protein E
MDKGNMFRYKSQLTVGIIVMLLVAAVSCSGSQTAAPAENLAEASISELADDVDVHTVAAVKDSEDVYLLDVREQWEYDEAHIPGVTLLPLGEVAGRLDEIPRDKEVIVTCRSGNRSGQVTDYLRQNGFDNVHNMTGGILDWQAAGYPVEP